MIERCDLCGNRHETGGDYSFGGIPWKGCPEVPEDTLVLMRKEKESVVIHGPQGKRWESYRYVLAGMPVTNLGKQ